MSRRILEQWMPAMRVKPAPNKSERALARLAPVSTPRRKACTMTTITDWKAKRSGASITLTGKASAGDVKLSIKEIASRAGKIIALGNDGTNYELA